MKIVNMDALIKGIQEFTEKNDVYLPISFINEFAENYIVDAMPNWIPCEERLPELDEICLVTEKDGSIRHCYFDSADPILFATVEEGMYVRNVIAWMSLPRPYEGEREDDE